LFTQPARAQVAALQAELAGTASKIAVLEGTIANLAHENTLLKRRLFGNKTERSKTCEVQLALGDLLAAQAQLQKELEAAVENARDDTESKSDPAKPGDAERNKRGRRNLLASNLPRYTVEILDEEREATQGCRRIGFEDSAQLMFRRGGFMVLVKRVAKYEVIENGAATVVSVPSPGTLFPAACCIRRRWRM
jgi:multidrug efflux pump subunit AcrA (membrane-fusion protein)